MPERPPGPIAMVTGRYPVPSLTAIDREVRALRAAGCEVLTVTIRPPREVAGAFQAGEARRVHRLLASARHPVVLARAAAGAAARPGRLLAMLRLALHARPAGGGAGALARHAAYVAEAVLLADHLRRRGVAQVHNHLGDSSGTVAMLAAELAGLPFTLTLHGPEVFDDAARWRLDVKIARARATVCISEDGRAKALRHAAPEDRERVTVIPCGVPLAAYADAPGGTGLLFVGRLVPRKGVAVLIEALALLRAQERGLTLDIVGDGPERTRLEALAAARGLGGAVRFLGPLDEAGVARALGRAGLLVVPSLSEGLPAVIMEAMASGRPVVASAVDAIPELVRDGETGLLVPPGDPARLAAAVAEMLDRPGLARRMGAAGRRLVAERHDADRNARRLLRAILAEPLPLETTENDPSHCNERTDHARYQRPRPVA